MKLDPIGRLIATLGTAALTLAILTSGTGALGRYLEPGGDATADSAASLAADGQATPLRSSVIVREPPAAAGPQARLNPLAALSSLNQGPAPEKVREISPGWVSADYAVVLDDDSGEILWARNADVPVAPASLTKVVTALVVLDSVSFSERVTVAVDARDLVDSTVMGISPGEILTVEDLLYGLMLPSGNDAAIALAQYVAGSQEKFADLMNQKVRSLGLTGSNFVNPHGLDAGGHVSTPYDMAVLARVGLRNSAFRRLAAARTYETSRGKGYSLNNLNQLLWRYAGADGVKIGYTDAAGRAIIGSAVQGGHRVIVAMMRSADIYADGSALLDWAFASYAWP